MRNSKNETRGTVCIKKKIQKSSNFLIRGKNKKYIHGQRRDQDGDPSHGLSNDFGGLPLQSAKAGWVISGLPQQFAIAGLDSNPRIAIAAKVLVKSKNLVGKKVVLINALMMLTPVLWNRNCFLQFRFRLLKSYGSGSDL